MSIMFLKIRSVSRGQQQSAVAKAAYITRDKLRDARTGATHDFRRVAGLDHAAILTPSGTPPATHEWTQDRSRLWNSAEAAETRRNARVAREYTIALPHELSVDDRRQLARQFAQFIADRYGAVVDLAVHDPTRHGDARNYHAHVLASTRELRGQGFGAKTSIELGTDRRYARGLPHIAVEFRALRSQWAAFANERLRDAHIDARLEPRSRAELERERVSAARPALVPLPPGTAAVSVRIAATNVAQPDADRAAPAHQEKRDARALQADQQRAAERWLVYRSGANAISNERDAARGRDHGLDLGAEL